MDRRERIDSLQDAMLVTLRGWQADMWTALPGIVQSFDPEKKTCVVQPTTLAQLTAEDGTRSWIKMPLLLDCPIVFPSGGGYTLTFPVQSGDECLVVFSSRCIDAWWQSGKVDILQVLRMHDLSDGFVFVGASSNPNVPPNISTTAVQLRNQAGTTFVEIDGANVVVKATSITCEDSGSALHKLVNDTFLTLYNAHKHVIAGGTQTTVPLVLATPANATTVLEAE